MYELFYSLLAEAGLKAAEPVAYGVTLAAVAGVCVLARLIAKAVLSRVAGKAVDRIPSAWGKTLYKKKAFHRLANTAVPIVLSAFADTMPYRAELIHKAASISAVITLLLLFDAVIQSLDEVYRQHEASKTRPIKSLLQVIEVVVIIVGCLAAAAVFVNSSVVALLGGIGAATAVVSLVFKDSILGFVAGIQLIANDMIRIGDWIEMPKYLANGTVVDLAMTTIKVENFDKTITSIPAYVLVSDAFINWRGMECSGGRQIKRSFSIDAESIRLCDEEMLTRFRNMDLLRDYLDYKLPELEAYNQTAGTDLSEPVNGRRLTNVGTFRAYIAAYLKQHPGIHREMTCMVRQLAPDERGLPLEIYAFANTVQWSEYEGIQADIFDHLYAVAPAFGLRIYQRPSGNDVRLAGQRSIPGEGIPPC